MDEIEEYKQYLLAQGADPKEADEYTEYLKSGQVATKSAPTEEAFDKEAALQGAGQSLTLGYLPEIQAATYPAFEKIGEMITGKEIPDDTYEQRLSQSRASDKALSEKKGYGYGQAAGVLATVPLVTAGAAKAGLTGAASLAGRLGQAGATGAAIGAAQNVESDGIEDNLKKRLQNAGISGAFGVAGQGAGEALKAVPKLLEKSQTLTALKAAGANTSQIKELLKKNLTKPIADFMNKSGLLKVGQGVDDVLEKSTQLADDAGKEIGQIYDDILSKAQKAQTTEGWIAKPEHITELVETQKNIAPKQLASDFLTQAEKDLRGVSGGKQALQALQGELDNLLSLGDDANIKDLLKYRQSLDDTLNWNKTFSESKVNQQSLKRLRSFVQDRLDSHFKAVEKMAGGNADELITKLSSAKDKYGKALRVKNISQNAVAREMAKMPIGLPEIGIGGAYGIATGDPLQGLAAMGATKGLRYLGPGAAYKGLGLAKNITSIAPNVLPQSPYAMGALMSPWVKIKEKENE